MRSISFVPAVLALASAVSAQGVCNADNALRAIRKYEAAGTAYCQSFLRQTVTVPATQTQVVTNTVLYTAPDAQATESVAVTVTVDQTGFETNSLTATETASATVSETVSVTISETASVTVYETLPVTAGETVSQTITGSVTDTQYITITEGATSTIFLTEGDATVTAFATTTETLRATTSIPASSYLPFNYRRIKARGITEDANKFSATRISSACSCVLSGVTPTETVTATATVVEFGTVVQTNGPLSTVTNVVTNTGTATAFYTVTFTDIQTVALTQTQTEINTQTGFQTETQTSTGTVYETTTETATEFASVTETATSTVSTSITETLFTVSTTLPPTGTVTAQATVTATVTTTVTVPVVEKYYCGRRGNPVSGTNPNVFNTSTNKSFDECKARCRSPAYNGLCQGVLFKNSLINALRECKLTTVAVTPVNFKETGFVHLTNGWSKLCPAGL